MTNDTKKPKSKLKIYIGILTALTLTMLAMLQYKNLGGDEIAFISDVNASEERVVQSITHIAQDMSKLGKFNMDTRSMLLDNKWWRLEAELDNHRDALEKKPNDASIKELIRAKLRQQEDLTRQMEALR